MPLMLITGPANAAKAGAVLERFRAVLLREHRPSPRDPRTGLTALFAPDAVVSFVTWRQTTSSRPTRPPSGSS